jgi:VWFA-related protein
MNGDSKTLAVIVLFAGVFALRAQFLAAQAPETTASDSATLQVHVRSVLVPVVVRDAQGHAVGNLKQEEFRVFDQGKRRTIIGFALQQTQSDEDAKAAVSRSASEPSRAAPGSEALPAPQSPTAAKRYIVFLFDDRHLGAVELEQVKRAGSRMLEQPLADGDRAVVLSFLGINSGMTHDRTTLQAAISKLKAQQMNQNDHAQCPDIDYYTADQILNKHSKTEWDIAYEQAANCSHKSSATGPANGTGFVEQLVRSAADQALMVGDLDVRSTLDYIRDVVDTMSNLPGRRTLVLVSPGFFTGTNEALALQSKILDLAASSNVTISTLNALGLSGGHVGANQTTAGSVFANITGQPIHNQLDSLRENEVALSELADGTGGTYFHNSNDLEGGFKILTAGPEYSYLLEFSLQDVKPNGTYHPLKVAVMRDGLKLQARRGYFAPLPPNRR